MSETEEKKEKTETPANPEIEEFWERLNREASGNWKRDFEELIKSDRLEYNGDVYEFHAPNRFQKPIVDKLRDEARNIDQDKEWEKYSGNVCERACILIKGMTKEKFDQGDYDTLEDLVTAWSVRQIRGFRRKQQSISSVLQRE